MSRYSPAILLVFPALWLLVAVGEAAAATKYVILHQWGGAPVSDVVRNVRRLESMPFDGTTVSIPASGTLMLGVPVGYEEMRRALAPMKGAFSRFTQNFVVIHTRRPPDVFDDWTTEIANWGNLARAARAAGLVGIFYDNEEYKEKTWLWPGDFRYPQRSLREYRDQMRLRGRQVMQAMVAEFPSIVVLTFHGPYVSDPHTPDGVTLSQAGARAEDLRGAFFVGMVEGAGARATVVDGGECYQYRSTADFDQSYRWRKYDLASARVNSVVIPPELRASWPGRVSVAFATYNKQWLRGYTMNPGTMRTCLINALRRSDKYVWVYVEDEWVKRDPPADWLAAVREGIGAGKAG